MTTSLTANNFYQVVHVAEQLTQNRCKVVHYRNVITVTAISDRNETYETNRNTILFFIGLKRITKVTESNTAYGTNFDQSIELGKQ